MKSDHLRARQDNVAVPYLFSLSPPRLITTTAISLPNSLMGCNSSESQVAVTSPEIRRIFLRFKAELIFALCILTLT